MFTITLTITDEQEAKLQRLIAWRESKLPTTDAEKKDDVSPKQFLTSTVQERIFQLLEEYRCFREEKISAAFNAADVATQSQIETSLGI